MSLQIFPLFYKNEGKKIGIKTYPDATVKAVLRECGTLKYSKTYKCWYLPYEKAVFNQLKQQFSTLQIVETSNALVQTEPLAHHTDIASTSATVKTIKTDEEATPYLRIVAYENRGWLVHCSYDVGKKLKQELTKVVWLKDKQRWFVPARKGYFAKLKSITGWEVPLLSFDQHIPRNETVKMSVHPEKKEFVLVQLPYHAIAYQIIKSTKSRYYDKGRKCWRIINQYSIREGLAEKFKAAGINVEIPEEVYANTVKEGKYLHIKQNEDWIESLSATLRTVFMQYTDALMLRQYSWNTVKNYRLAFKEYCEAFAEQHPDAIAPAQAQAWLTRKVKEGWGESVMVTMICALRFYYVQLQQRKDWEFYLPFPRKSEKLPQVLSSKEVKLLFDAVDNLKHKTMLLFGYAAGLRVSEVASLQINNIDSQRMVINIKAAKGKKDRCVMLSGTLLDVLRLYYKAYQPKTWLFEGQFDDHYSTRSIQAIFQAAKHKAGIRKEVSFHSLRHSFATHLHEAGTGHNSSTTTERYTHVSNRTIQRVQSPLDTLLK